MKYQISDLKNWFFLQKYQSLNNTRRLCSLVGFSNIMTCLIFYCWVITSSYSSDITTVLLVFSILFHTYLNILLIQWAIPYDSAKWIKWAWVSLISISPAGMVLIYIGSNEKIWNNTTTDNKNTALHSLTNSSINLIQILNKSIKYLQDNYPQDFSELIEALELDLENVETWPEKIKYIIIALHEALKQSKKNKDGFKSIVPHAHWYDQRYFDFAVKDPRSQIIPNLRYKYSFGFIVLDEFNNYQKILDGKKEIKANMRFGPAKSICLHWGKGFKIYVNEQ